MINLDKTYILNPHYHLRHDIHRVVLFSKGGTDYDYSRNWHTFIHPLQAALLSFFTYNRTMGETLTLLSDFFCKSPEIIEKWMSEFINNPHPVYTYSQQGKIYFPKRMLIEVEEVQGELHFDQLDASSFIYKKPDLTTRRLYTGPLMVTFMLTNRCTTHCKYCYADTATVVSNPLPTARIMELIDEAAQMQVQQVNLMGGEIFLHKDWQKILKRLVGLDIAPGYISTKIPMTHEKIAALTDTGYQGIVQVSLDACDAEVLQASIGAHAGYTEAMLKGLRLLDESSLNYQISSVLTTYNCDIKILDGMLQELSTLKQIRDWRIVPVNNSITKGYKEFVNLKPSQEQITTLFHRMRLLIEQHGSFPIILGEEVVNKQFKKTEGGSCKFNGSECSALTTHLFVLPDGKVTICEQLYWNPHFIIGNVTQSGLKEVWNSQRSLQLYSLTRNDISSQSHCRECSLFESCFSYQNRCWSDIIKAYGTDCWDFPDPRCIFAPEMKNRLDYE